MNYDKNFEQLYEKILVDNKNILENYRELAQNEKKQNYKLIIKTTALTTFILLLFTFFIIYVFSPKLDNTDLFWIIAIIAFMGFSYGCGISIYYMDAYNDEIKEKEHSYTNKYKLNVIKQLLTLFNQNIEYFPDKGILSTIYNESEFENSSYNGYASDDLMQGILNNTCKFSMAEVYTEDINEEHCNVLFHGLFAKIETPKSFSSYLYIRNNNNGLKNKNNIKIEMDSQEFEEVFDVYSSNKIIAMQLLTSDIMQLLINFKKEININYELTIKNNYIYLRFFSDTLFETPKLSKLSVDKDTLYKYYKTLDFTFLLTDKLINLLNDTEYDDN